MKYATNFNTKLVSGNVKSAMRDAGAKSSDLWKVPRSKIKVIPGFNVRSVEDPEYIAHIRSLANSILTNGYYQDKPMTGYVSRENGEDVINLTDGHSRLAAFDIAMSEGFQGETLPVIVKPQGTNIEDLMIALVTGNSGRPLTPYETAVVCKRLIGYGLDSKTIAQRLGYTKSYVDDLLMLMAAPSAVRDFVTSGKAAATVAIATLKADPEKAADTLAAGLKIAEEAGKTRVSNKHLKPKARTAFPHPTQHGNSSDVIASAIHYPDCWDTTAYPTLADALTTIYASYHCTECCNSTKEPA